MLAVVREVLRPTLHGDLHDLLLVELQGNGHDALALELPTHRARLGHGATAATEEVANLGTSAVAVVGQRFDDDGHATGGVALVVDGLVPHTLEFTGAAFDRLLNGVQRNGDAPGLLVHGAQGGVGIHIATSLPSGHLDLANAFGEHLGPGLVLRSLAILRRRPLRGTRHVPPSETGKRLYRDESHWKIPPGFAHR